MVGMARKNEKSAAAFLFKPKIIPPIMVAADLEVPEPHGKNLETAY